MSSVQFFESRLATGPKLPLRSTMITTQNGQKILFSPVHFNDEQLSELTKSPPHALVAPNLFHHLHVKEAATKLQVSTIFIAPGLERKRPDIPWPVILGDKTWSYENEIPLHIVQGMPALNECVFFHKASKTLIVTDLMFNLFGLEDNLKALPFKMLGTFNRPAISRLLLFIIRDKSALRNSLRHILEWDFDRIVMAHGKIIETNGKNIFLDAAKERGLI